MPKFQRSIGVKLTKDEITAIILEHLGMPKDATVTYGVIDVSERDDSWSTYAFHNAEVNFVETIDAPSKFPTR